jgi:uncharacterized SAM-binding protein YcdF (DUF218 family)
MVRASGVDPDCIVLEEESRNTRQQAAAIARILGPEAHVMVVTDRYHVPRARYLMRRRGLVAGGDGVGRSGGSLVRWIAGAIREVPAFGKDVLLELLGRR